MTFDKFTQPIAQLIEAQFPDLYREEGEQLVAFIKAYYEFLESDDEYSYKLGRQIFEIGDIDTSLEKFLFHFKETYLVDFPYIISSDKRFVVKNIIDYYRAKGSKQSLELLMRLLFNEEATVYNPGDDVLRASDSLWYKPFYLEVTKSPRTATFKNKQIVGAKSGAKAFVESIVQKRVNGKLIDVLYLSDVRGQFLSGERISNDGVIDKAPKIKGSMTSIDLINGGQDNAIGDILNVVNGDGLQGKVKVSKIASATGRVDFDLINGGWGYTLDGDTKVYTSDALVYVDNFDLGYIPFETVYQNIETVNVYSANTILSSAIGSRIYGLTGANVVSEGVLVRKNYTTANGVIQTDASSYGILQLQVDVGTFLPRSLVGFGTALGYLVGERVTEESTLEITITGLTGTYTVGELVEQIQRDPISNSVTNYAFGTVVSANSTTVVLNEAFGEFLTVGSIHMVGATSAASSLPVAIEFVEAGASGIVSVVDATVIEANNVTEAFTIGKKVLGESTRNIQVVTSVNILSPTIVQVEANTSANGLISSTTASSSSGIVIGQNTTCVGVFGNTSPFYFSDTQFDAILKTDREKLVSPPRDGLGDIIQLNREITRIAGGAGASFEIGLLSDTEVTEVYVDTVGGSNIVGTPYLNVQINGEQSGIGIVDSITVLSGGTGYANGDLITFSGGGLGDGSPLIPAVGSITTNGSGSITSVTMTNKGAGYYSPPSLNLPSTSGTVASCVPVMAFGYGFPQLPSATLTTPLVDFLDTKISSVGKIALLSHINPGQYYTADPFIKVYNQNMTAKLLKDFVLDISGLSGGTFAVGERLIQTIGPVTSVEGRVKSISYSGGSGRLFVERITSSTTLNFAYPIIGESSGASATIVGLSADEASSFVGDNAVIGAKAGAAQGVATSVEVITSGFGYVNGNEVTLESPDNPYIMSGVVSKTGPGISEGYWKTTTGHTNSEKKIHDNKYYQEYSYDVLSGLSLDRYESILKKVFHVSGMRMFGSVVKASTIDSKISVAETSIQQVNT